MLGYTPVRNLLSSNITTFDTLTALAARIHGLIWPIAPEFGINTFAVVRGLRREYLRRWVLVCPHVDSMVDILLAFLEVSLCVAMGLQMQTPITDVLASDKWTGGDGGRTGHC